MRTWKERHLGGIPPNALRDINCSVQPFHLRRYGYAKGGERQCVASQALIMDALIRACGGNGVSDEARQAMVAQHHIGLMELDDRLSEEQAMERTRAFMTSLAKALPQTAGMSPIQIK